MPQNYKLIDIYTPPPEIETLVYHDLGNGKEFCGIIIKEEVGEKNKNKETIRYEVKLDDKSAQKLIDFLAGDTKWKNNSHIEFSETKSPRLKSPADF